MTAITPSPSTKDGASTAPKSMGEPTDAIVAFVDEVEKTPGAPKPDANVAKAVATGWHARELLGAAAHAGGEQLATRTVPPTDVAFPALTRVVETLEQILIDEVGLERAQPQPAAPAQVRQVAAFVPEANGGGSPVFLRRMSRLPEIDQLQVVLGQLAGDLRALDAAVTEGGQSTTGPASTLVAIHTASDERDALARRFGSELAQTLFAADFRLGKAYAVGWDLASLADAAQGDEAGKVFIEHLKANDSRTEGDNGPLTERLDDLASVLPANAAHAVGRSIELWLGAGEGKWFQTNADDVHRQVQTWRALLTGERSAADHLLSDDLPKIASGTSRRLAWATMRSLASPWLVCALAIIAAIAVIALELLDVRPNKLDVAEVATVLAAFGATWKAIGTTAGAALSKTARPIWDAQTDAAIAERITRFHAEAAESRFR